MEPSELVRLAFSNSLEEIQFHGEGNQIDIGKIQYYIWWNQISYYKKSNFTLEQIQVHIEKNSNFKLEEIQSHIGRNPISPLIEKITNSWKFHP